MLWQKKEPVFLEIVNKIKQWVPSYYVMPTVKISNLRSGLIIITIIISNLILSPKKF